MKLLACQLDSYRRSLATEVLSCEPVEAGHAVVLDDSVLYPEGGGQPADQGVIVPEGGVAVPVTGLARRADGDLIHQVATPLPLGPARIEVDWARRFDHMQQHSAQHLLSALAEDRWGLATCSFHLGEEVCSIDLEASTIAAETLRALSDAANQAIREARPIRARVVTVEEKDALPVRSRGLPAGHRGPVRLIEIEGVDLNTCGGTHVASTAELQLVHLLGVEGGRGRTRLFYLSGERARRRLTESIERESLLGRRLTVGVTELPEAVDRLQAEVTGLGRRVKALSADKAASLGVALTGTEDPVAFHHHDEADLAFLSGVVRGAGDLPQSRLVFLTGGEAKGPGVFLLVGPEALAERALPVVLDHLEARGGGKGGRYQGKATRIEGRLDALRELGELIPSV